MIFGPKAPSNETDEAPTGFWNGETLESRLPGLIDPFVKDAIDCAAYTLKMGAEVYVSPNEESPNPQSVTIRTLAENEAFTIPPGQFAFLLTEEIVTVPADAIAFISIKAKIKWRGLINVSGFHVDPGFKGRLIFSVFNAGPVPVHLRRGQDLFLIWYASLDNPTKELRAKPIQEHIPAELISGIAGEVQSLAGLSKKMSAVEKDLVDRVHKIEKEQTRYRIYAGIVGGIIAAIFTVWLRDSFFYPKAVSRAGSDPVCSGSCAAATGAPAGTGLASLSGAKASAAAIRPCCFAQSSSSTDFQFGAQKTWVRGATTVAEDIEYLANYKSNQLYTHPGKSGAYATIVGESEEVFGELDVTDRCKLAVSAFYVKEKGDFGTLKITKLRFHQTHGWREDGHIQVNHFQVAQMKDFLSIISNLNLGDAQKTRLSLDNINVGALGALLGSSKGATLIRELAETPELHHDIYAVATKRKALVDFEHKLAVDTAEGDWQAFFETNPWIFGHGLNYISLDKVSAKLENTTTGHAFDQTGKRTDALVRTRAEVSQYVLVEIKKHTTNLLRNQAYRAGCWGVSDEVSNAVTQIQKTTFDFTRHRFKNVLKDAQGNDTDEAVYSVEPRSFLVMGNTTELHGNDDKVACFELYRRNIRSPEILTFDELLHRARFIVQNISRDGTADE